MKLGSANLKSVNYVPFECRLVSVTALTKLEKLFRFERLDAKPFGQQPGQFVQVSIPGFGEAPISVSSSPTRGNYLELGVRKIGALTGAMHDLKVGDKVGMRGPFGTFFPIADLQKKDLVLIAGGCGLAPLRSLIQYVEDRRAEFGNVTILYGAKSPEDLMYQDELQIWKKSADIICQVTVDNKTEGSCWDGDVGLITKLIPPLNIDPSSTVAVICGPPIMYKFVIEELSAKGLDSKSIVVSLERHMKCGVGKCGHCTIEHLYCCLDGPVFWLHDVYRVRGAL
ncbi:MAG: FAD/NAD(P)-binding protein [Gammaproteobacteria bacterium]